jgi:hypothetical protein
MGNFLSLTEFIELVILGLANQTENWCSFLLDSNRIILYYSAGQDLFGSTLPSRFIQEMS